MFRAYVQRNCDRGLCFFRCEPSFINTMVCMLKEIYLMPSEIFIRQGDVARELYFVADGVVQLMEGSEVKSEIRGDVAEMACLVGEVSFFLGVPQAQNANTSSAADVRMLVLAQQSSEKLLRQYPEQLDLIRKNILASYNLDTHGRTLVEGQEEEDVSRQQQHDAIVLAIKRRDSEAFAALSYAASMGEVEKYMYKKHIQKNTGYIHTCM